MIDKGIDGGYVHIIDDYLSNRLIRLKINNSTAQKNLSRYSPQGGGLSNLVWNSDFDDMLGEYDIDPIILSSFVEDCEIENNVQAFADDSQLMSIPKVLTLILEMERTFVW